jgi:hypothetical protein
MHYCDAIVNWFFVFHNEFRLMQTEREPKGRRLFLAAKACTRQGSNLQPYDPKSCSTRLASSKVKTDLGLSEKIVLQ